MNLPMHVALLSISAVAMTAAVEGHKPAAIIAIFSIYLAAYLHGSSNKD